MECMDQILTFIILNQYIFFPTENDDASLQFKHSCQVHFYYSESYASSQHFTA